MRLTVAAGFAMIFVVAGAAPAAACHATAIPNVLTGFITVNGIPTVASIQFDSCEGTVSVTIKPLRGATDTFDAQFDMVGDSTLGTDCLFSGGCSPFYPPAAAYTLTSVDRDMVLAGSMVNVGHAAFIFSLAGTYLDAPASFHSVYA